MGREVYPDEAKRISGGPVFRFMYYVFAEKHLRTCSKVFFYFKKLNYRSASNLEFIQTENIS